MTNGLRTARDAASVLLGAALISAGFNLFLIPHELLSGGVSGIAMLIGYAAHWDIGTLYFALNIPLFAWSWFRLGRRFVFLSFLSVAAASALMQIIPEMPMHTDPLAACAFGGLLVGIGTGLSFRAGGSTGGFDIIGAIVLLRRDAPLGMLLFALNGAVIAALAVLQRDWDSALYSVIAIFVTGRIIDVLHTRQIKMTAFIVTEKKDEMVRRLLEFPRGVTVVPAQGGFTGNESWLLMTVTTRYELQTMLRAIREVDGRAFVNMVETASVMGLFRRDTGKDGQG